jgi:gliding motility-associated-like protein
VTLTVTNTANCVDVETDCNLVITPEYTFYIPNAFSPNNDGINDVFRPQGEHIGEFSMRIYNRWGELVFFTKDFYEGWDGRLHKIVGQIAQEDVYVYMINIEDKVGEKHQYIGHVTIIK